MKSQRRFVQALWALCVVFVFPLHCHGVDREAFSIPNYQLNLQVDPAQHRLAVRGTITLRNDRATPQTIAVLQISSSLDWRSIKMAGKQVQFVTQPYTSDIDHTGSVSEAIVTMPQAVPAGGAIALEIAYEGIITVDGTRLTRIGTPEEIAKSTDWDAIDPEFTALRGSGYVAWYPIMTDVANLSESDSLFEVLDRWKQRQAGSQMRVRANVVGNPVVDHDSAALKFFVNGKECGAGSRDTHRNPVHDLAFECGAQSLRSDGPTIVIADYHSIERSAIEVRYLEGHDAAAAAFADTAERVLPLIADWFGKRRTKATTADLPDANAVPYESGALLLIALNNRDSNAAALSAAHQLTHASFMSSRPWIEEGVAHFAQALYVDQEKGRQAALDYLQAHRSTLIKMEQSAGTENAAENSLVKTTDAAFYRGKAMAVWWMLRDMIGDSALKKAFAAYRPEQDQDPSYMPRLVAAQTQRDLDWFFDDWVYRDRGLPDFRIESAYPRKTMANAYILTVTVDNVGNAGAEVPVLVKFAGGEANKRLEVRAKSKATIRIETPGAPQAVTLNDGSVPESDTTNNTTKVEPPQN